ncbi:hypothetical protein HNQ50_000293 [Silvimonas terrae]|uniref:Uncharacterized protein n=1 Tax=Silvimonas terrae TaxID=300266 RepID=A0A840RAY4_9NEIS|nr:hypothetical protein [Silvimonas terrae]
MLRYKLMLQKQTFKAGIYLFQPLVVRGLLTPTGKCDCIG